MTEVAEVPAEAMPEAVPEAALASAAGADDVDADAADAEVVPAAKAKGPKAPLEKPTLERRPKPEREQLEATIAILQEAADTHQARSQKQFVPMSPQRISRQREPRLWLYSEHSDPLRSLRCLRGRCRSPPPRSLRPLEVVTPEHLLTFGVPENKKKILCVALQLGDD